ncbi:PhoU domain-containing protein [Natronorubrum sp. DTA7]|uniref:PhoU domain-containing protein n=1 Tax=Natronorubrum sp. DTA7 TaxID=3447016 RepID=UPI003F86599F
MSRDPFSDEPHEAVERNVQFAGNSTFVVSLPKRWATAQGLESGEPMYLYPREDRLIAAAKPVSSRERATVIDAGAVTDEHLLRRVRAAYTGGADRITIVGIGAVDERTRRSLEASIGHLIGMEIFEATDERITAETLLDATDVSLPQVTAQARRLTLEMHDSAIDAVRTDDARLGTQVIEQHDDVDRLFALVSRGFHRGLEDVAEVSNYGTDRSSAFRDYRIARQLERVADNAGGIAAVADRQSGRPDGALADRLEATGADVRTVVERALAGEGERASESCSSARESIDRLDRRLYERGDSEAYLYGTVLERLRRTAAIGMTLVDATTDSESDDE